MILATIASAIISLAVSNIVVTALTVLIAPDQVGCFGPPNPQYTILGPHSTLMRAFDWSWISSGVWTSIVVGYQKLLIFINYCCCFIVY